jgi:hypothetical protein
MQRGKTRGEGFARSIVVALFVIVATAPACVATEPEPGGDESDIDDYGIVEPVQPDEPLGKADNAGVPGPRVSTYTGDTQVWTAKNKWEDTSTVAAQAAGMAWPANSGLTWEQKYEAWVESMTRTPAYESYYETFTLTTPWGKTLPGPRLECAELAIFLRVTFAAWYNLPFYLTAIDGENTRIYFGHFGARTVTSRYKSTPLYASAYADYSSWTPAQLAQNGWPKDEVLRSRGIDGPEDDVMDFIFEGARAGAYFDEIHLNKRVGHFLRLVLAYFSSVHLAGSRNTYNVTPESVRAGDVLVERWQRNGIGHALVVKHVRALPAGAIEADLVSGSMPRRQPKWEDPVASKRYFTAAETGGEGTNSDGEEYVKLGGGLKRFRVTKNINGYWTNTWMAADEASWINDTNYAVLKVRPTTFDRILGQVAPAELRTALLGVIEDARNHLREYPASCSARSKREDAFEELYELMETSFSTSRADVDAEYRLLEDYVFAELEYTKSKTCCWNSSTSAMYRIAMDYNESLQENACSEPVVFKCQGGGYQAFASYASQTGRAHEWKAWSEDESCPQRTVTNDTELDTTELEWCEVSAQGGGSSGGCSDDGYENNDSPAAASSVGSGSHSGLMVCTLDDDYFTINAGSSGVTVSIAFSHAEGDIDLALYKNGSVVSTSTSVSNSERVTASGSGTYQVRIYGYQSAQARYTLTVQ